MSTVTKYLVKQGDTLHSICNSMLGDASRIGEVILLNKLVYPYIDSYSSEGVVSVGDYIMIPRPEVDGTHMVAVPSSAEEDYARLFGVDLMITHSGSYTNGGGELVATEQGDLATVSGVSCLRQDVRNRLITEEGSLPYHPDYGSRISKIIGTRQVSSTWEQELGVEISRCLLHDPRIVEISDLDVKSTNTGVYLEFTIVTNSKEIRFDFDTGGVL